MLYSRKVFISFIFVLIWKHLCSIELCLIQKEGNIFSLETLTETVLQWQGVVVISNLSLIWSRVLDIKQERTFVTSELFTVEVRWDAISVSLIVLASPGLFCFPVSLYAIVEEVQQTVQSVRDRFLCVIRLLAKHLAGINNTGPVLPAVATPWWNTPGAVLHCCCSQLPWHVWQGAGGGEQGAASVHNLKSQLCRLAVIVWHLL